MTERFRFSFEEDWRSAPGAYWVHRPVAAVPGQLTPPAPISVPHRGFAMLHVEFGSHELLFSSLAQVDHYIDVLSKKALPTSRQLSEASGAATGPNQHWLSRLPAELKSPKRRFLLVKTLRGAREFATTTAPSDSFNEHT